MYWLIDESKLNIYLPIPPMTWKITVVAGVALSYEGRKKWRARRKWVRHGPDYTPLDEAEICAILQDMIECQIEAVVTITDIGYASFADAEQLRLDLITPLYSFADKEPMPRSAILRSHLDNLLGKENDNFSLQDFYKVWNILEVIAALLKLFTGNLQKARDIDLRKLRVFIDDQARASLKTLKEFVYFFIHCRSNDGIFSCPPGTMTRLRRHHLRTENGVTYFNANSLVDRIFVEEHGANMDDKYPELKIADLISNFSRRVLQGDLPYSVAEKLNKIIKIKIPLQATPHPDLIVNIPAQAQAAVNLLIE